MANGFELSGGGKRGHLVAGKEASWLSDACAAVLPAAGRWNGEHYE